MKGSTLTVSQTKPPSCPAAVLYPALVAGAFKDTTVTEAMAAVIDQTHFRSSVMPVGTKG